MEYTYKYESPLGEMTIASDGEAITGIWFAGQKYFGSTLQDPVQDSVQDPAVHGHEPAVIKEAISWLDAYFEGKDPGPVPAIRFSSTKFREEVWKLLLEIPYGHTMTYGEIASVLAKRNGKSHMSAQAVGGAVGHNPISIMIPCHRVVGADGSLTGYAGGVERKAALLELEASV